MYRYQYNHHQFQSTLPVWGATRSAKVGAKDPEISIHAPRVGSDGKLKRLERAKPDFNPRSPCGERLLEMVFRPVLLPHFNPRSPCGERRRKVCSPYSPQNFNPRSPCGERRGLQRVIIGRVPISIHAPRVGSDAVCSFDSIKRLPFQSTLPVWGATCGRTHAYPCQGFQSTLPVWGATTRARSMT